MALSRNSKSVVQVNFLLPDKCSCSWCLKNSRLIGEIIVANADVARIKSGMKARIKLDAFPEREYGVLNAEVQTVARNATQAGPQGSGITGYKVRVGLDKQGFRKGKKEYPFQIGMSLTGLIVTRYDSLFSMAIKKILNIKDDLIDIKQDGSSLQVTRRNPCQIASRRDSANGRLGA